MFIFILAVMIYLCEENLEAIQRGDTIFLLVSFLNTEEHKVYSNAISSAEELVNLLTRTARRFKTKNILLDGFDLFESDLIVAPELIHRLEELHYTVFLHTFHSIDFINWIYSTDIAETLFKRPSFIITPEGTWAFEGKRYGYDGVFKECEDAI